MTRTVLFFALCAVAQAADSNPLGKVIELLDGLAAKVTADGEAQAKAYHEYFEWCDDVSKNTQNEIKTAKSQKAKLEAKIAEESSKIDTATSKVEELAGAIAKATAELKDATKVRETEAVDFAAADKELVDTVDTLDRAIGILQREMAKNPSALAQLDSSSMTTMLNSLSVVVDAAAFTSSDKKRLMALVQSQQGADDEELGAPAAAVYKSHSGGIFDLLEDLKEKGEGELSKLRKDEANAKHNFAMLKQSLEDKIANDEKDMANQKADKAAAEEAKAGAEGELEVTIKELKAAEEKLASVRSGCIQVAADHEASLRSRAEELQVIAQARKILVDTSKGAVDQTYSFLQLSTSSAARSADVVGFVKRLAVRHHSAALAQLASRITAVVKYGANSHDDVFAKVKDLINDMIAKLKKQAEEEATEKAYCDEEMSKTETKKSELDDGISKLTAKIDQDAAKSASLKEEVAELQNELAELAKEQAEMDQIREEQHADYVTAKADLELGLSGVRKALQVLRDYYAADDAALLQQPAKPVNHAKGGDAAGGIISILEVCESDFATNLAKEESEEEDAATAYEKTTQENKVDRAAKDQDVKYKTQEFNALDKSVSDLTSDRDTANEELDAVMEYYGKLKERCVAKPESYEERKARREAEINGLKEALSILENDTAFVQRKRHGGVRGTISMQ
jgi:predicted  nucleic acid-binding Zn-ribbon protein